MQLKARLKKLERQHSEVEREPFRLVVSFTGKPVDLTKATCTRTIMPNGQLMELVKLNCSSDGLSEEDLEKFIRSHPIKGPL